MKRHGRHWTPHSHIATPPYDASANSWCPDCHEYLGPRYSVDGEPVTGVDWSAVLLAVFFVLALAYIGAHILVAAGVACPTP